MTNSSFMLGFELISYEEILLSVLGFGILDTVKMFSDSFGQLLFFFGYFGIGGEFGFDCSGSLQSESVCNDEESELFDIIKLVIRSILITDGFY